MLNQVVLVGRIASDPKINEVGERKECNITIAVPRSYKNVDGVYETDYITTTLWNGIAQNTVEYCKKGDLVGIRGRLQTDNNQTKIIAEKLTFLSSKAGEINEAINN